MISTNRIRLVGSCITAFTQPRFQLSVASLGDIAWTHTGLGGGKLEQCFSHL